MGARLTALENRLRQTERALVEERLARQTAGVAQQTVETWPAGVDAEEIGTLPMSSGDIGLSERTDSMPWLEDPIITDSTAMRERKSDSRHGRTVCLWQGAAGGPTSSQRFRV